MSCRYLLRPEIAFKLLEYSCSTIFASKSICRLMVTFMLRRNVRCTCLAHLSALAELSIAS